MTDSAPKAEIPSVARNAADFDAVFDQEFSYVWNSLRRLGVHPQDLKDQSQEVFLTVHNLLPDYDPERPMRPWLFGIAYRVAARYRTSRARHPVAEPVELPDPSPRADEQLATRENQALVIEAIRSIDIGRAGVFVLADLDGVAVPEIAATLGIPLNTAYSRLRVAREEFKKAVVRLRAREGLA
jgi:RNA polymerase sigma-70 factor (ECF subfamily)